LGLAGVVAVVTGIWLIALSVAAATVTAYPSAYWPAYVAAAVGVALVASGAVVAGVFL
jgi:hypothetical protein